MLICAYSDFGFSSLPHTQRTKYRCKWEYFSLLFKIEFAIVEAESHFAQLSLAQNSNLHRFPLVAMHLYESLFLSSRSVSFLPSRVCVCLPRSYTLQQIFHALSQFTNSLAFASVQSVAKAMFTLENIDSLKS